MPVSSELAPAQEARTTRAVRDPASPLALWHLLSLDAPTVAVVWTWFAARSFQVALSGFELAAMFVAVWMLYAADRLLDARALGSGVPQRAIPRQDLEPRHFFHARHRAAFTLALALAGVALVLCLLHVAPRELGWDALLGSLLAGWFGLIHACSDERARQLPKELAVGAFFAAAVFVPAAARQPASATAMLVPATLFGLLCTLNGLLIRRWEAEAAPPGPRVLADTLAARVKPLALLIAAAALAALFARRGTSGIYASIALSTLALLLLDRWRQRLAPTHLRALADAVLLSPLLLAALWR